MVSLAEVVPSASGSMSGDCPGISDVGLGWNVRSEGAVPAGRV
jgi:hypothetical protein